MNQIEPIRADFPAPRWGSPIDFGKPVLHKIKKDANPLLWGAWGGIGAAVIATIASFAHQLQPSQTIWGFGMGGLTWCYAAASVKNWLYHRRARRL